MSFAITFLQHGLSLKRSSAGVSGWQLLSPSITNGNYALQEHLCSYFLQRLHKEYFKKKESWQEKAEVLSLT